MILVSDPGKGKSELVKPMAKRANALYCKASQLTEFQFYKLCYAHRNENLVLDDIETLLQKHTRHTLQNLTETDYDENGKTVGWYGSTSLLTVTKGKKTYTVPHEFETTSRVCIVCNDWAILSKKLEALHSRALILFFDPDNAECHDYVKAWFLVKDEDHKARQAIYDFIGRNFKKFQSLDVRWYPHSLVLERKGLDWKAVLEETWTKEAQRKRTEVRTLEDIYAEVEELAEYDPGMDTKEKIFTFSQLCKTYNIKGGSRATYFRLKRSQGHKN